MKALSLLFILAATVLVAPAAHANLPPGVQAAVNYGFENDVAAGVVAEDLARGAPISLRSSNGGVPTRVVGYNGVGSGIALPAVCRGGGACPRAIYERPDDDTLDPGTATIRFGASMLLRAEQTSGGENIVQKGYSTGGGQYKLQVDGVSGRLVRLPPAPDAVRDHRPLTAASRRPGRGSLSWRLLCSAFGGTAPHCDTKRPGPARGAPVAPTRL